MEQGSAPDFLPDLPGVKVSDSVRRMGGNVDLYYSLLDMFSTNQKNIVQEVRASLASGDFKTAERQAHTLRGIAGNLGAESLQHQAELLEKNIKDGVLDDVEPLLKQINHELDILLTGITRALNARTA